MKKTILTLAFLFVFAAQAYSQTYEDILSPGQDTFTDTLYHNQAMGDESGDNYDRLWAGPVINTQAYVDDTGHWVPAIDGTEFAHTYLRFNLSGVSNITDATLWLYRVNDAGAYPNNPDSYHLGEFYKYNDPDVGNLTVYYETDNQWSEATMTWDSEPSMTNFSDNTAGATTFIGPEGGWQYPNNGGWVSWDVTAFAQAAKTAGDQQLTLVLANDDTESPFDPFHIFYSSESTEYPALRPYLGVNVVPEPISMLLFGVGGAVMAFAKRKKQRS